MVAARLYGGLGNRMFQQAAAIGYAEQFGLEFDNNKLNLAKPIIKIIEKGHEFNSIFPFYTTHDVNYYLDGYFQSEKYFLHAKDEVRRYYAAPVEFEKGVCSIHVRRGDYLLYPTKHPVVTVEYLQKALVQICSLTEGPLRGEVYSDDIEWCKTTLADWAKHGIQMKFMPMRSEKEDMYAMAQCEHNIIANSTFSWWGAWLNPNPNKIVISPSAANWFGTGNAHLETKDIIPDNWIQIKY